MAHITMFGRVMQDLTPKESHSRQPYVCFDLMEQNGGSPPDFYQVWANGTHVARLKRLGVKKGSMIWITGSQKLVDIQMKDGKTVKKPKIWLTDFGLLPGAAKQQAESPQQETNVQAAPLMPPEALDGDRTPLPE